MNFSSVHSSHHFSPDIIDAILSRFDIEIGQSRRRREFHGDRQQIGIKKDYVFDWVPLYRDLIRKSQGQCELVFAEYEPQVNQFGYSLRNLTAILPTPHLNDLMLKGIE